LSFWRLRNAVGTVQMHYGQALVEECDFVDLSEGSHPRANLTESRITQESHALLAGYPFYFRGRPASNNHLAHAVGEVE